MSSTERLALVANLFIRSALSVPAVLAIFAAICGIMLYIVIFA